MPFLSLPLSINGTWSGYYNSNSQAETCGVLEITINTSSSFGPFSGSGIDAMGPFEVRGTYSDSHVFEATFTRQNGPYFSDVILPKYFFGKRDPVSCKINGEWSAERGSTLGTISLEPIPLSLYRFRHLVDMKNRNPACIRWSFACAVVLDQVRRSRGLLPPWRFFQDRITTRKHYIELYRRRHLTDTLSETSEKSLIDHEKMLLPADILFYRSIARSHYNSCIHL